MFGRVLAPYEVSLEFRSHSIDFIWRQNRRSKRLDIPAQSGTQNIDWQSSLKPAVANEVDDRVNRGLIDLKEFRKALLLSVDLS
jgi:hypothetical protein